MKEVGIGERLAQTIPTRLLGILKHHLHEALTGEIAQNLIEIHFEREELSKSDQAACTCIQMGMDLDPIRIQNIFSVGVDFVECLSFT